MSQNQDMSFFNVDVGAADLRMTMENSQNEGGDL